MSDNMRVWLACHKTLIEDKSLLHFMMIWSSISILRLVAHGNAAGMAEESLGLMQIRSRVPARK